MTSALHIARSGLDAEDMRMRVISNNLANVNTTGFKRDRANFESLMYQNYRQVGAPSSQDTQLATGLNIGTGVRIAGTERMHVQGSMSTTGNSLDVALDGSGFFQVLTADGTTAYTRDGSFHLSDDGQLVTSNGLSVQPEITLPQGTQNITIGTDGTVSVTLPGDPSATQVGTLTVATFINDAGLQPIGENLFRETAASGTAQTGTAGLEGRGRIQQGMLEASNVNVVEELVNMIETQRAYEVNSKVISTVDDMLRYVTQNM
jgi:flagellar basal-body rod protein FlgG